MAKIKRFISMTLALAMILCILPVGAFAADEGNGAGGETEFAPEEYTNLLIGTGSATSAGPEYPSGSIQPSPETTTKDNGGYTRGYPVVGFGQLYCQGTGGTKSYGNFLLAPMVGDTVQLTDSARAQSIVEGTESALCYQYSATFANGIAAKVTPAQNSAIYSFTYPAGEAASFLLDAGRKQDNTKAMQSGSVTVDPETNTITGGGTFKGNWNPSSWNMYFALQFDAQEAELGTYLGSTLTAQTEKTTVSITSAQVIGAYVKFAASDAAQEVKVKIAISFVSEEKALEHLNSEIPEYDYDAVCAAAKEAWNEKLGVVEIETDDEDLRTRFYTALYHLNVQPRDRTNDHGNWDDFYTIWDSWKTAFPLKTLLYPEEVGSVIASFVNRAQNSTDGYVMSDAYIQGKEYAAGQGGNDIENIIVDAFLKDVPLPDGLTWEEVYQQALVKSAENMRTTGYVNKGFVTAGEKTVSGISYSSRLRSGSATLGFAVNDIAVATMAQALGYEEDYEKYIARSKNWLNVWNEEVESDGFTGFVQSPNSDGTFASGYDPKTPSYGGHFYEATSWDASYLIHYDLDTLIEKMGGRLEFIERLQWACEHSINYYNDDGGKEGYLNFTNEPSMQIPWLFCTDQIKRPDLAAETINRVIERFEAKPMDYPGDEDNGAMSSYYIFLMSGFFPYSTTNDYYLHGSRIPKVTFHLGNGKDFVITSDYADGDIYVQSATWNGEELDVSKLTYEQISEGGVLAFDMGSEASDWGRLHDETGPSAVTDLTADSEAAETGTVALTWTAAEDNEGGEGVARYEIHRGTSYGFTCTDETKVGETSDTAYTEAPGLDGRYWYQVVAVDGAGNKSEPAQVRVILSRDSTPPGKVSGLTVEANNLKYGVVTLKWDAAAEEDGVVSYNIYQGDTEEFIPTVDNLLAASSINTFTMAPSAVGTYFYKVIALDANDNASEASEAVSATVEVVAEVEATSNTNHALNKSVTVNGYTNSKEAGAKAVDGSLTTKWCVKNESTGTNSPLPHWIEIDLGTPTLLSRWVVSHAGAGGEESGYNTRDFQLQYYDAESESWITVDDVVGNTANVTDREFTAIVAEKVRMYITTAITSGSNSSQNARVYEIELYSPEVASDDPYYGSLMYLDGVSYAVNSQAATAEGPEKTKDGNTSTKWSARYQYADTTIEAPEGVTFDYGVSWISVDLGQVASVTSMKYLGAGEEAGSNGAYRTKEMYLQTSENGESWTYVDSWVDSDTYTLPNDLDYEFDEPITSQYFRLILPVRGSDATTWATTNARVLEWHLFGSIPMVINVASTDGAQVNITPETAKAGETVNVEVSYTTAELEFMKLEVIGASGTPVAVTGDEKALAFSFVMPNESVTVKVYSGTTAVVEVVDLIDLIGEVTLESTDAINAAREAYDVLTGNEKENVYNYNALLTAESEYAALVSGENADAAEASKAAAEAARKAAETAQSAAEQAEADAVAAKEAAETAKADAQAAKAAAEEAQAKAEEAQNAAEEAVQSAGTDAAAALAAKTAAENAKDLALAAQEKAEQAAIDALTAQTNAEIAEANAETAEASAKEAQAKAAEAAEAAEESNLEAAREAAKAAEEAAKAATEAGNAAAEAAKAAQSASDAAASASAAAKSAEESAGYANDAAQSAKDAQAAQKAAEDAQAAAEAAQKAAEEEKAAAEAAKGDAEAAQKAAEAAQEAAEAAQAAAEAEKAAAEAARKAAEDAKTAAEAARKAAEENQLSAEAAQEAAKTAQAAAEAAQKAAEEEKLAAETARAAAEEAEAAAEEERLAAEAAKAAAEEERKAAEDAKAASEAAQKAAEEAALNGAKYQAALNLDSYAEQADLRGHNKEQLQALADLVSEAKAAIAAAEDTEEIQKILDDTKAEIKVVEEMCPSRSYTDVAEKAWYHSYVDYMIGNGYMNGISNSVFDTDGSVTRAQLVTILYRVAGEPFVEGLTNPFEDVAEGKWYTDAIIWAANEGIVKGVSETGFAPMEEITRQQIVTILYRYDGSEAVEEDALAGYSDAAVSAYAVDAMNWAIANGIVNGVTETTLAPAETATRAQICAIVMRYLNK